MIVECKDCHLLVACYRMYLLLTVFEKTHIYYMEGQESPFLSCSVEPFSEWEASGLSWGPGILSANYRLWFSIMLCRHCFICFLKLCRENSSVLQSCTLKSDVRTWPAMQALTCGRWSHLLSVLQTEDVCKVTQINSLLQTVNYVLYVNFFFLSWMC